MEPAALEVRTASRAERAACLLACLTLLLAGAAAHVWYLLDDCPLDLSGDEAHYWEWSRRLDFSYYSKGPLVAYIIAAGRALLADWSRGLLGSEVLAVRLPAVLLSLLTGIGVYTLALETTGRPRVALGAVALTFTIPILAVGAVLMTIDAPLMCCWTWALVSVHCALTKSRRHAWLATGMLTALGVLAKFNMLLLLPTVGLLILTEPRLRGLARRPAPYQTALLGLLGLAPILLWNAQHDWVSFRHVAGQAGLAGRPTLRPGGPLEYVAGQAAVVGPVWFLAMLAALGSLWRRPVEVLSPNVWDRPSSCGAGRLMAGPPPGGGTGARPAWESHRPESIRLLALAAALPWLLFLGFALITKVQPNWPVVALVPGVVLLAIWGARGLGDFSRRRAYAALLAAGGILGAAQVLVAHRSEWLMPVFAWMARDAPPWDLTPVARYDPSARLRGWSRLGRAVGEVLDEQRRAGRDPFILTDDYQLASQIAFYCPGQPRVYCAQSALGGRRSQYDIWTNPIRDADAFTGRPVVYVGALHPRLTGEAGGPAALPDLRPVRTVEHAVRGQRVQLWTIWYCDAFAGFARTPQEEQRY